ncbi:hypothetical protein QQ045_019172 [Rhodiola kirilowii]
MAQLPSTNMTGISESNLEVEGTFISPGQTTSEQNEVDGEGSKSKKSFVWDHFTKLPLKETQVTVDNASSNDTAIAYLQKKLDARGGCGLVFGGKYLHMRCCAHNLNLIVNEGIKEQQPSIDGIRNAVRYVRSSPLRLERFRECVEAEMIESKSLVCLDVPTRWNSTYMMLEHAEKYEKAFDRLYDQESVYRKWFREDEKGKTKVGPPTHLDWQNSRIFIQFLQLFYEMTLCFSGSMACSMRAKYDKYWGNVEKFNPLLFVAVVLDPLYKFDYLTWILEDTYDQQLAVNMSTLVKATIHDMYEFYAQARKQAWKRLRTQRTTSEKSDLERYLEDNIVDEIDNSDFDILNWWKSNSQNYKVLSAMARDVLAIPVSTVASESCFSTSGRVFDIFRSSLSPRMAEALICAQNWLNPIGMKSDVKDFDLFEITDEVVDDVAAQALASQKKK